MDVTCLQPFELENPYFFRWHHKTKAVGNILKCPPQSPIMKWCFSEAKKNLHCENRDWMLPMKILNEGIIKFSLEKNIKQITNPDSWPIVTNYLKKKNIELDSKMMAIHWMNEEWRRLNIPKNEFYEFSLLAHLLELHKIEYKKLSNMDTLKYKYKLGMINYTIINLPHKIKSINPFRKTI